MRLRLVAKHTMTGLKVAMKFISKRKISTAEMSNRVHREVRSSFSKFDELLILSPQIQYLSLLRHPHIIKLSVLVYHLLKSLLISESSQLRRNRRSLRYCHGHRVFVRRAVRIHRATREDGRGRSEALLSANYGSSRVLSLPQYRSSRFETGKVRLISSLLGLILIVMFVAYCWTNISTSRLLISDYRTLCEMVISSRRPVDPRIMPLLKSSPESAYRIYSLQ